MIEAMKINSQRGEEMELIAAILAGHTHLYHRLIGPYERRVYIMALSVMKNREDAEDVAQEAFLRAFRRLRTFRGDSKFGTWLISIALNEARNTLRRQITARIVPLDDFPYDRMPAFPTAAPSWRELPSEVIEREEIRKIIRAAVDMIPEIYQQVFLLRHVEEFSVSDSAEILNVSAQLVKVRLHRARIMLQKLLAPQLNAVSSMFDHRDEAHD
jgi:RNA polymerase sigma-70 factor (ECF subfamily)